MLLYTCVLVFTYFCTIVHLFVSFIRFFLVHLYSTALAFVYFCTSTHHLSTILTSFFLVLLYSWVLVLCISVLLYTCTPNKLVSCTPVHLYLYTLVFRYSRTPVFLNSSILVLVSASKTRTSFAPALLFSRKSELLVIAQLTEPELLHSCNSESSNSYDESICISHPLNRVLRYSETEQFSEPHDRGSLDPLNGTKSQHV